MKYRILFYLTLILLLNCTKKETNIKPLLAFIPENASIVIKITDYNFFKNTLDNNDFLSELSAAKAHQKILDKVSYLKYIEPNSESLLALTEVSAGNFEFIYVTKKNTDLFQLDSIQNQKVETFEIANSSFVKYTINDAVFYSLSSGDKIIISSSKLLLQQLNDPRKPVSSELLKKLYRSTSKIKPASILINLDKSNSILKSKLNDKSKLNILGFSDWISLDLDENQKNFHISGISIANDSTLNFIDLLANTKPTMNNTSLFAPKGSDAILSYTYDNYAAFSKNKSLFTDIDSPINPDLNAVEEIGVIYLNGRKNIILNTFGGETIAEYLRKDKKGSIEFKGNEILALRNTDFLNVRFSPLVKNFDAQFCTIIQNAFIFSEDQNALKTIIQNHKDENTFNKSNVFQTVENEIAKESSILFIANSKKISQLLKDDFTSDFAEDFKNRKLSDYAYAAQTITDKNFYHTNLVVQKIQSEGSKKGVASLFVVDLPNEIATNPQFVVNHLNNTKEIIVQDQKNILYLISSKGKIIWKKELKNQIQGKIHQVDIFKNGRLQLAFTTYNQLFVLDRNGKEVKQFSKTFEGGNLNPLAVFDYEKKKNYRFVITQNDKIYMYNSKAEIVKGFKFTKAEQPIIAAPKHLIIGNKDYLAFKLKGGTLKLLNRVGDIRTKVSEKIDFSENEIFVYKSRFTLTDKKGIRYEISSKGKVKKTSMNFSNDHGLFSTARTLVTMDDNMLQIKEKKLELEMGVYTQPEIFYINDKIYVSVTDLQNEKIYLFDSQANSISGFPINGASKIDLSDMDRDKNLKVVAKKDNSSIMVYKL